MCETATLTMPLSSGGRKLPTIRTSSAGSHADPVDGDRVSPVSGRETRLDIPAMVRLNVDMKSSPMTIGQVAGRFGLPTHVLRHWESMGLLRPTRVAGDRRRYTRDDLARVASIVVVKRAGRSLVDIR